MVDIYQVNERQYHMAGGIEGGEDRDDVAFKTKDGQKAWISVTIRYRIDSSKLPEFHRHYGKEYMVNVLRPSVRSLVNNKLGEYSAEQIYDGKTRQEVAREIRDLVNQGYEGQDGTAQYGLIVSDILFRRFEFSEEYQAAIEQKRIAAEQALAAEQWAIKREKEAIGEKLAIIQRAEADAQKVRKEADAMRYSKEQEAAGIRAKGQAEAEVQELMAAALGGGDNIVRMEFARHLGEGFQIWGIPTGENSNSIMDVSGIFGGMFPKNAGKPVGSGQ